MSEPQVVIKNPSPKLQFLSDAGRVGSHRNLMQVPQMRDSLNMALLEHQRLLFAKLADANGAAAAGLKMSGAMEFVNILIKLGEAPEREETSEKITKLDYKA